MFVTDYFTACEKQPLDAINSRNDFEIIGSTTAVGKNIDDALLDQTQPEASKWEPRADDTTPSITFKILSEETPEIMKITLTVENTEAVELVINGHAMVQLLYFLNRFIYWELKTIYKLNYFNITSVILKDIFKGSSCLFI